MIGKRISQLPTPALLIDQDTVVHNLTKVSDMVRSAGKKLRPHIKTHKIPAFAKMQIDSGAVGICTAKVSEAEVMAEAGANICNFRLSRQKRGGEAVMTIEVDGTFGPEINERIKTLDNVFSSIMLQPI